MIVSEQSRKRRQNRYDILRALQAHGPMRRRRLGEFCGIRLSSITSLINELVDAGILCSQDHDRPRSPMIFTRDRCHVVSLALSSTGIESGLVGLDGALSSQSFNECQADTYGGLLEIIQSELCGVLARAPGRILGIGLAMPGIIDPVRGICHRAANFPYISDQGIRDDLAERFKLPVYLENDVRCGLWAGIWFDQLLAHYQDAVYLSITSGINSALLINGLIHPGVTFAAGEIGHVRVGTEGRICKCGNSDCLESYASIPALIRQIRLVEPALVNLKGARDIAAAARRNPRVADILNEAASRVCRILAPLMAYVDPQVLLLGNQDYEFYEAILPALKQHLAASCFQGRGQAPVPVDILRSEHPVIRGVAGLLLDTVFKDDRVLG